MPLYAICQQLCYCPIYSIHFLADPITADSVNADPDLYVGEFGEFC